MLIYMFHSISLSFDWAVILSVKAVILSLFYGYSFPLDVCLFYKSERFCGIMMIHGVKKI